MFDYLKGEPIRHRIEDLFREPRTAAVFSPRAYLGEYEHFRAGRRVDRPFLLHALFLEEWARMFDVDFT
jgi:hypothetical protein